MILAEGAFFRDEKRDRVKYLADDIAAQTKTGPNFDIGDINGPHNASASQKALLKPFVPIEASRRGSLP